jgi:6,7-dimethyl-8-ribityllumazine synthase
MKQIVGSFQGQGLRFAIVVSSFNEFITKKLLEGSIECLRKHGVEVENTTVAWVPGAFEIPVVAKRLALTDRYDAIVTLGAIIKGSTAHFDYVASQAAAGVASASHVTGIPVIFGILTTDTIEQALERAGTKMGNKGFESAMAAIEMANLMKQIEVEELDLPKKFTVQA